MDNVWQERCDALADELQQMAQEFSTTPTSDHDSTSLHALTRSLLAFSKDQFDFFWHGFSSGQLLPSMVLPEEHVMRAMLDQVAYDMSLIQRIKDQRRQKPLRQAQETADKLAQLALNVAVDGGLLPRCSVLTYFNKSANIRLIPYAPIALIGIPFSATRVSQDLLAIPHEVGHFVYHHAPGLAAKLHAIIPLHPDWVNHWIEELFADLFAAFVAGPVGGLSLQEIMLDNSQENFTVDDGEHPPNAVRPYVFNHTLRHLGDTQAADELDKLWEEQLARRHYPNTFVPYNTTAPAALSQAKELLVDTVENFLEFLKQDTNMARTAPWSNSSEATEALFDSFAALCKQPLSVTQYHLAVSGNRVGVGNPGGGLENARPLGHTQTWRDWIKEKGRIHKDVLLPAQAWTSVFTAGHWPVKGPEGNSNSGV